MNKLTETDLRQFTGDLERHRHLLSSNVIYTSGVRHLAEEGGAYWLIDAIASHLVYSEMAHAIAEDDQLQHLQFWKLKVNEDQAAELTCIADTDCPPAILQAIPWTDFPLPEVSVWVSFNGQHWTLFLPSEYYVVETLAVSRSLGKRPFDTYHPIDSSS